MAVICGLPLDGNRKLDLDQNALAVAIRLAQAFGQKRVLATHIIDDREYTDPGAVLRAEGKLSEIAKATTAATTPGDVSVEVVVKVGPIATTLSTIADVEGAALIVVASRNRTEDVGLGSVAGALVSIAAVPVLLLRDATPWLACGHGNPAKRLRLLTALDDTPVADLGLAAAVTIGLAMPTDLVLGAVYYSDSAASRYGLGASNLVDRNLEAEALMARDLSRRVADVPATIAITTKTKHGLGRIGDHVVELANEAAADVIVLGTTQRTGLGKLGSTSSVVVQHATQSVLCVPPTAHLLPLRAPAMQTVVVATDGSAFANRAIPLAFGIVAGRANAQVHVVQVVDDDANVEALTAELAARARIDGQVAVQAHVLRGDDVAQTIAGFAARLGADAICIASHGRSGIARVFTGSVADNLIKHTRLPVMVVRPAS